MTGARSSRSIVQQGEVVAGVGGDELGDDRLGLARQPDTDLGRPVDDVGVGQDLAVGGDDDAGADGTARAATSALIVTTDGPTASATSRTARRPADRRGRSSDPSRLGDRWLGAAGTSSSSRAKPTSTPASPARSATTPARDHDRPRAAPAPRTGRARRAGVDAGRRRREHRHRSDGVAGAAAAGHARAATRATRSTASRKKQPTRNPPTTSENQCTPRYVRLARSARSAPPTPTASPTTPHGRRVYRATTSGTSPHSATRRHHVTARERGAVAGDEALEVGTVAVDERLDGELEQWPGQRGDRARRRRRHGSAAMRPRRARRRARARPSCEPRKEIRRTTPVAHDVRASSTNSGSARPRSRRSAPLLTHAAAGEGEQDDGQRSEEARARSEDRCRA